MVGEAGANCKERPQSYSKVARLFQQRFIGMKHPASTKKNSKSSASSAPRRKSDPQFAVCVDNGNYPAFLEVRKIYQILPDKVAGLEGLLRVIDESGEDYLYPKNCFLPLNLPKPMQRALTFSS